MEHDRGDRLGEPGDERLCITIEEAARMLGLGRHAAYAAARLGHLPTRRFGRKLLVPKEALRAVLEGRA